MSLAQLSRAILALWHDLIGPLGNPYRPELHYMRGPGPKWHAKHRRLGVPPFATNPPQA